MSVSFVKAGRAITDFGARPEASGRSNLLAFQRCVAACREEGVPVLIPAGQFNLDNLGKPIELDLVSLDQGSRRAIPLVGQAGPALSVLRVQGDTGGLRIESSTDWFDPIIEGLSVRGSLEAPLVSIGRDDFKDPVNMLRLRDVSIENSCDKGDVVGLRLNYIAPGSDANGLKVNCLSNGRGRNYGTAIECRQVEAMTFVGGAASNAAIGLAIRKGVNFGICLQGLTFENTDVGFSNEIDSSGSHIILNSQFSEIRHWALRSTGCNTSQWIEVVASNFALDESRILDPTACEGIRVHDRRGIRTPDVPPSGHMIRNLSGRPLEIQMWGGMVHALLLDGHRSAIQEPSPLPLGSSIFLAPGGEIGLVYGKPPSWRWVGLG